MRPRHAESPQTPSRQWRLFFFSSRRRHTRCRRDWSSDVCSSDLLEACPIRLSGLGIIKSDIRSVDRGFFFDDTTGNTRLGVGLLVLLDHLNATDQQAAVVKNPKDLAALAFIFTGNDDYFVVALDLFHTHRQPPRA